MQKKKILSRKDNSNELANTDENNSTETQVDASNDYNNNEVTSTEEAVPEQEQVANGKESQSNNSVEEQQDNQIEQPSQRPDPNTMSF
ncbi:hypothetical protein NGB23_08020 [Staphylococcus xylosus]|uniref:Uncharacterized protein n=1 Tax=Staphylococcus xylosus TaxID=1288 RepID=A0A5R9B4C7_STAXY|nr:hypothetical protein [Staphylococcus xylosus]MEB7798876.1 hypothetical protein [Staphylococcus xylosus]PTH92814.1 hypothetical protein BU118_11425 [Staphylococcus xylosus]QDW87919.1 hypothetical protein DWB98_00270 [Staphylococcus xylosus]TLP89885.1 hypothetical protein FEZ53_10550 [Staphylococcus xylosus]